MQLFERLKEKRQSHSERTGFMHSVIGIQMFSKLIAVNHLIHNELELSTLRLHRHGLHLSKSKLWIRRYYQKICMVWMRVDSVLPMEEKSVSLDIGVPRHNISKVKLIVKMLLLY